MYFTSSVAVLVLNTSCITWFCHFGGQIAVMCSSKEEKTPLNSYPYLSGELHKHHM